MDKKRALRSQLLGQMFRFALVGGFALVINAIIVELLARVWGPYYAQFLAFPLIATMTWYLNRRYTFGASARPVVHEWFRYIFANLLGWVANNGVYVLFVLHVAIAYQHPSIAVAAGSLTGLAFNFVMSRVAVFRNA
ncbi:GtrA family protein [Paraburkholderia acidiphila]|uniref:GtrA family protein n=1 Tax=Paraburkholderia acidiphila TaxID=2571747 RepID=A0A7Z2G3C2_9BURK|nr:GtrA family protein [Paraburkholderia acidiphila]QGZ54004.1 GtrA family protein [Paraburkholderia acidiphila]